MMFSNARGGDGMRNHQISRSMYNFGDLPWIKYSHIGTPCSSSFSAEEEDCTGIQVECCDSDVFVDWPHWIYEGSLIVRPQIRCPDGENMLMAIPAARIVEAILRGARTLYTICPLPRIPGEHHTSASTSEKKYGEVQWFRTGWK